MWKKKNVGNFRHLAVLYWQANYPTAYVSLKKKKTRKFGTNRKSKDRLLSILSIYQSKKIDKYIRLITNKINSDHMINRYGIHNFGY